MSSFEFLYAKMTAQSQGWEPGVQGDKPEFTPAFIAQCAGMIKPGHVYHAAMAFYCQSELAMSALNQGMANWCWKRIQYKDPKRSYKALEIARVAELAVLMYLYPWREEKRSIKSCAKWARVSPQTWNKKYAQQRDIIVHELAQMKSDGDAQLSAILRE